MWVSTVLEHSLVGGRGHDAHTMTGTSEGLCVEIHGGFPTGTREVRSFWGDSRDGKMEKATGGDRDKNEEVGTRQDLSQEG